MNVLLREVCEAFGRDLGVRVHGAYGRVVSLHVQPVVVQRALHHRRVTVRVEAREDDGRVLGALWKVKVKVKVTINDTK